MNPWDITRYEHDPLGGPDIVHFADGHRMPVKAAPPSLRSYVEGVAKADREITSAGEPFSLGCLLTEANDDQAFVELPDCEHCHGTGKNLAGWDPHQDSP